MPNSTKSLPIHCINNKIPLTLRQLLPIVRRLKELPVAVLVLVGEGLSGAEFELQRFNRRSLCGFNNVDPI